MSKAMEKKYELTDEVIRETGVGGFPAFLYRIKSLRDFECSGIRIHAGDLGGYIESVDNLSHEGSCWVFDDAKVFNRARVRDQAIVRDDAMVSGLWTMVRDYAVVRDHAKVYDNAIVSDCARVAGDARVSNYVVISGNAHITGNAVVRHMGDYIVFKEWWFCGFDITWTRSNNLWHTNIFYGTDDELIRDAYKRSEKSGREYERIVKYVEEIRSKEICY